MTLKTHVRLPDSLSLILSPLLLTAVYQYGKSFESFLKSSDASDASPSYEIRAMRAVTAFLPSSGVEA